MKQLANFHGERNAWKTYFILALLAPTFFLACKNSVTDEPVVPTPTEETVAYPDSIFDLVGYFDSGMETFFIDPAYIESVLALFDAQPTTEEGIYIMAVPDFSGVWHELKFVLAPLPIPEIYYLAEEREMILHDSGVNENDIRYKTYRHATCPDGTNQKKEKGKCVDLPEIDEETEAASYKSEVEEKYTKCEYDKDVNNLCTENLLPVGFTYYYNQLDCDGKEVDKKPYKRFRCR